MISFNLCIQSYNSNTKVGWEPNSYIDAVKLAETGNVKQLELLHHDTTYLDDFIDEIVNEAENILREKNLKIMCVVTKVRNSNNNSLVPKT